MCALNVLPDAGTTAICELVMLALTVPLIGNVAPLAGSTMIAALVMDAFTVPADTSTERVKSGTSLAIPPSPHTRDTTPTTIVVSSTDQ
jgi:hypothetical protein